MNGCAKPLFCPHAVMSHERFLTISMTYRLKYLRKLGDLTHPFIQPTFIGQPSRAKKWESQSRDVADFSFTSTKT